MNIVNLLPFLKVDIEASSWSIAINERTKWNQRLLNTTSSQLSLMLLLLPLLLSRRQDLTLTELASFEATLLPQCPPSERVSARAPSARQWQLR
jgi:hypothetical protein